MRNKMKFIFSHRTYSFIEIDSSKLKQVKDSYYVPFLEPMKEMFDFRALTNFSHSNCMWTDDFWGYKYPEYVDQPREIIQHEFDKLQAKYGTQIDNVILDNEECVTVPIDFSDWLIENLVYNKKLK